MGRDTISGEDGTMSIEVEVGALLLEGNLTLACAESCTGGLVAHRITNVPGSSAYFLGGIVAYANEAKEALLGVRHETWLEHGAVSEETAREMARGARRVLGADVAVSTTGIAGPSGGTPNKPVGLVYIALSAADTERCERHVWRGDRSGNKEKSAQAALRLLLAYLKESDRGSRRRAGEPHDQRGLAASGLAAEAGGLGREEPGIEFMGEPVSVEVRTRRDGTTLPVGFVWHSCQYQIESWGREGLETRQGRTWRCYLVQTAGAEAWKLCQETETAQWQIARHWAGRLPVV
jgi:PncC family amidohydrolase